MPPLSWSAKSKNALPSPCTCTATPLQLVDIEAGVVRRAGEGGHQRFGGRVAIGGAHRGDGGIGTDSRILVAQVPGGMLTNLEGQLKQQSAAHRLDEVLAEIPRVREDLGFIPLVTPTSQIVGTQAVLNVLGGERYKTIAKETAGILKGRRSAASAGLRGW
jgi:hypothetical protein